MLSDATTNGAKKITPAATTSLLGTKAVTERDPENWHVTGWYKEAACDNAVTEATEFSADTTIYAKWEKVTG